jgi:hypothetical protein
MRIISVIATFALATVTCADVTTSNSGVAEATLLQTRSLLDEVYEVRSRPRQPVNYLKTPEDEGDSADPITYGNQSPPYREVKKSASAQEAPSTENGGGVTLTRGAFPIQNLGKGPMTNSMIEQMQSSLSTGKLQREKDQLAEDAVQPKKPRKAVNFLKTPEDEGDSADPITYGNQAPPYREVKKSASAQEAPSTENGGGVTLTRGAFPIQNLGKGPMTNSMMEMQSSLSTEIRPNPYAAFYMPNCSCRMCKLRGCRPRT